MDPVSFWLVFLLGGMSVAPFMFMFGAAVKQRQFDDARWLAERIERGFAEDR